MRNIFVDKFGGSSVASPEHDLKVVENIGRGKERGENIVVYCSARKGITNQLEALCKAILSEGIDLQKAKQYAGQIIGVHLDDAAKYNLHFPVSVAIDLNAACREMITARDKMNDADILSLQDRIVGIGERFKVRQIAALGKKRGLNTVARDAWNVGFITDDNFRNAHVPESQYATIRKSLEGLLVEGKTPIVTGFIGKTADGRHTTGGRGSSDRWAAIAGAALYAKEIRINNAEIHGMYSINPKIAELVGVRPRKLDRLTYGEMDDLSLHNGKFPPGAMDAARGCGIPVRVLNAFDTSDPSTRGTFISKASEPCEYIPRAFTSKYVKLLTVHLPEMDDTSGYAKTVYDSLAKLGITAEMGDASSNTSIRIAFDDNASVDKIRDELAKDGIHKRHVTFTKDVVQIHCVGNGIGARLNKTLIRVHTALDHAGIEPIMLGSGASLCTYGIIVEEEHMLPALNALHNEF